LAIEKIQHIQYRAV
jgi:hypothetical protein